MAYNQILISGNPRQKEGTAGGAITPGHVLDFDGSGDLVAAATAASNGLPMVAKEASMYGDTIDDAYASGDNVEYYVGRSGDVFYMWLSDGENVSKGDPLQIGADDGELVAHTPQAVNEGGTATYSINVDQIIGYAAEDLNNSAGGAEARIKVEIA